MAESREVRCLDCGHEWNCRADYPQCADPNDECGRSRNVEPIAGLEGSRDRDPETAGESHTETETETETGQWSPVFETAETETEPVEDMSMSEPPELGDDPTGDGPGDSLATEADAGDGESPEFETEDLPELEPEDIELFVKTPFDVAAKSRGDHWELDDDELGQLSHAYCRVGNKYAPYLMKEHAPEILAAVTTVAVVGPRVAEDKEQADDGDEPSVDAEARSRGNRRTDTEKQQASTAYDKL